MIKINLAKRKSSSGSSSATGLGGLLAPLQSLLNRSGGGGQQVNFSELPLKTIVFTLIVGFGSQYLNAEEKANLIRKEEVLIEKQRAIQEEFQKKLAGLAKLEEQKKALSADYDLVKRKIETITSLVRDRETSIQILSDISSAIPTEVWLLSLDVGLEKFSVSGHATEFNHVSDFMKRLEQSKLLGGFALENSNQTKDQQGVIVTSFNVKANRK